MNGLIKSFLPCLLKWAVRTTGNWAGAGVVPLGDFLVEGAESYFGSTAPNQQRADLERVVQDPQQFRKEAEVAVQQAAANQPPQVRAAVSAYFAQVPGAVQRSLQRHDDPSGRTVPAGFHLSKAKDLLQVLPQEMPRFKPGDRPVPGTDLVVEELLGKGGFGEVWRAVHRDRPQSPPVALKFCIDEAAARSLRKEVELLDRVSTRGRHPSIVELKYTHLSCNPPCLEYEYIEGGDLAGLIVDLHRTKQMTPPQAAQTILRLAKTVGFAHREGIVHRDLKPANILLQRLPNGRILLKVADFGIGGLSSTQELQQARETASASASLTVSRGTYTPLYASPQQKRFGKADARDDVFALGVIWYQMLSGDLTRGPPSGGAWKKKLADQGVPLVMVALLEECIEEDEADRPADAQVLADRLQAILQQAAATAPRPTPVAPPPISMVAPVAISIVPVQVAPALPPPSFVEGGRPRLAARPRRKKSLLLCGGGGVLLLGLAFATWRFFAGGSGLTDELRYLPDNSRFLVSLNVRGLLTSTAGQKILASKAWKDFSRGGGGGGAPDFETSMEKTWGLPVRDVTRVTVGGTFNNLERDGDFVVVVKVRDARRCRPQNLKYDYDPTTKKDTFSWVAGEFDEETIGKFTLKKARKTGISYCIPDGETVLFGPAEILRGVLRRDKVAELAPGLREAMGQVDFSQALAGAVALKDLRGQEKDWFDRYPRRDFDREMPGLADAAVTVSAQARVGAQLDLEGTLVCHDAAEATRCAEQLSRFLKDVPRLLERDKVEGVPQEFLRILAAVQFTASGSRVSATLRIDPEELTRGFEQQNDFNRRRQERWEKEATKLNVGPPSGSFKAGEPEKQEKKFKMEK